MEKWKGNNLQYYYADKLQKFDDMLRKLNNKKTCSKGLQPLVCLQSIKQRFSKGINPLVRGNNLQYYYADKLQKLDDMLRKIK